MNNLSWVIYLADVINNLNSNLGGICFFLGCGIFVTTLGIGMSYIPGCPYGQNHNFKLLKWPIIIWVIVGSLNTFIPTKQTILLIAGSEVTERVVNTPQAQEILSDVQQIIKEQLSNLKEKK